jgi:hypothetical protein
VTSPRAATATFFVFAFALILAPLAGARTHARPTATRWAKLATSAYTVVSTAGFETSTDGWEGYNARVASVAGGATGQHSIRVTHSASTSDFAASHWPAQVSSTDAGATYSAVASIRSITPGPRVCLRMREWVGSKVVGQATSCLTTSRSWQKFSTISYDVKNAGDTIDVYAFESPSRRTDSFDLDGVTIAEKNAPAPPPPPVPDPPPVQDPPPPPPPVPGPPPVQDPPSSSGVLYGSDSLLNQRIPANAAVDPNSAAMVDQMFTEAQNKGWPIASKVWTNTVFYADASTPRRDVVLDPAHNDFGKTLAHSIPVPSNAFVSSDDDAGMSIIDKSTNCEIDFGRAHKNADGSWSAGFVNGLPAYSGSGVYPSGAMSASGFANIAGTIMPDEVNAGQIDHALAFTMNAVKTGGAVSPATSSDGRSSLPGAIPEGARVQLDPNLDLNSLGLNAWQKTVARALQVYGMFLVDTGGAFALRAQQADSFVGGYPWGNVDYAYMPTSLASHLRVLQLGPQLGPNTYNWTPSTCVSLS